MLVDFREVPKCGGLEESGCRWTKSFRSEDTDRQTIDYVP